MPLYVKCSRSAKYIHEDKKRRDQMCSFRIISYAETDTSESIRDFETLILYEIIKKILIKTAAESTYNDQ